MTTTVPLGTSGLSVPPLCLGGNVFGWTADEEQSFAVLDAFAEAGGTFIDTADVYSAWAPGHSGGESEAVLGRWMAARGNRDQHGDRDQGGVAARARGARRRQRPRGGAGVAAAAADRPDRPLLRPPRRRGDAAGGDLRGLRRARAGRAWCGRSAPRNFSSERLSSALAVQDREGWARYTVVQPLYNLLDRELRARPRAAGRAARGWPACRTRRSRAASCPASTGRASEVESAARAEGVGLPRARRGGGPRGARSRSPTGTARRCPRSPSPGSRQQPTVAAPIASGRTAEQLAALLPGLDLVLTDDELARPVGRRVVTGVTTLPA